MFKIGDKVKLNKQSCFIKRFNEVGEVEKIQSAWLLVKYKTNPYDNDNADDYYDYIYIEDAELINE